MTDRAALLARLETAVAERAGGGDALTLMHWDHAAWEALLARADIVTLGNGDVLIQRNAGGNDLYFVAEGTLEVSVPQARSISIVPGFRVEAGSIVGEVAFFDERQRSASVWSSGPSTLFRVSHDGFEAFRRDHPARSCDLIYAIARILAGRLRRAQGADVEQPGQRGVGLF
jgi:CRP-like cAMP-binding protein